MTTPPKTTLTNINVSLSTYDEIFNALTALDVKVNRDAPITITKDMSIKNPINYKQVTIRKDMMQIAAMCYKTPINEKDFEVSNSEHFCKFADDLYNYVLTGELPNKKPESFVEGVSNSPKNTGWN